DGRFVCVVAGSDANFTRLCRAMERPDLLDDPRFTTLADRARHGDEINGIVGAWTVTRTASEVESACVAHDVPVATAYTAREIATDPHFVARGDLVEVDDPVLGPLQQQAPYPRFVGEAQPVPAGAPTLGADNEAVWCGLAGLSPDELAELQAKGVV
ncbi:MAG TPA: CoA transferase, partial [Acidimicrobiales bacterium]|nr:CoA transferase [Acidimicrobiales bacterium]